MRKFWKIFFITLGSILGLALITVCIALWLVFTPARLTPIVRRQAPKFVTCQVEIERVELTFFRTFPRLRLEATGVTLINPIPGAPCDTLLGMGTLSGAVDVRAFLKRGEVILSDIALSGGTVCAYINKDGGANFDIFSADAANDDIYPADAVALDTVGGETTAYDIDLESLALRKIHIEYLDEQLGMSVAIPSLSADIKGALKNDYMDAAVSVSPCDAAFAMDMSDETEAADSAAANTLNAMLKNLSLRLTANMTGDDAAVSLKSAPFRMTLDYGGEKYLDNTELSLGLTADGNMADRSVNLRPLEITVEGGEFSVRGSARQDTLTGGVHTDLAYNLPQWNIRDLLALVPASFASYLEGVEVTSGTVSSSGTIVGEYRDSTSMPMIDIELRLENGAGSYAGLLPFPLRDIDGEVAIHTDLTDAESYVNVGNLSVRTPRSSIRTAGKVDKLFSDIRVDLATDADLVLDEFGPMIPDSLKATAKGRVKGNIKTALSLAQFEKMDLGKMKLSGVLQLTGLNVLYDSISVATDRSELTFSLPNASAKTPNARFAAASVKADNFRAAMTDSFDASLRNADIYVETSDPRDTTRLPALLLNFSMDGLQAAAGSMSVDAERPSGSVEVAESRRWSSRPAFGVTFSSGRIAASMDGDAYSLSQSDIRADIAHNEDEKELLLRWMADGEVDIRDMTVEMPSLGVPINIPAVFMDCTPNDFTIHDARVQIGETDMALDGHLTNVYDYFKGDSVLRGEFNLLSNFIDGDMLLAMTNGIGGGEDSAYVAPRQELTIESSGTTISGPYIVPTGVDLALHSKIAKTTLSGAELTNIRGDIIARDGILLADELRFSALDGDMQLTAKYRSPRKNHIYMGIDLHIMDIELARLRDMIPDLEEVMPMLRSFSGRSEFHMAMETYTDSLYNLKMSTLRGAASLRGYDLVLMDVDTFNEVVRQFKLAKILLADTKHGVRIDSLSAEFTVFRDEVDVYPFLISVDQYKAVVAGRHNIDSKFSFDYNISLVESPLPFRATVRVYGNPGAVKFKLSKPLYPDFYRPAYRRVVETEQLRLRQIIREGLLGNVKKEEEE